MAVAPGSLLGRYQIISPLGEGGMGEVHLAQDTQLGRQVAIKFPTVKSDEHHTHARFLREARSVSALSHRNIATIYDYGETEDGQPYLVMELIKGESLSDLMHSSALTLSRSVEIIADVAEALAEAHKHDIIHRDIKPSNVMINERDEVKVLDFGLAKQLREDAVGEVDKDARTLLATRTQSGVVVGTPLYLSPEQARSEPVDARSDIFALGSLLYECIAGRPAFFGKNVIEITAQIIHVDPPLPSTVNSHVPPKLDEITMKALAKAPEARYQSAGEMQAELREAGAVIDEDAVYLTQRISPATKSAQSSALQTLSDLLQRPRISVGKLLVAALAVSLAVFLLWYLVLRSKPYVASADARKWFETGMNAMREGSYNQARNALQNSVDADGNFALAYAGLAEAWTELDYAEKGREALLRSEGLLREHPTLERQDRLYLDAVHAMVTRQYDRAINAYASIVELLPDQPQVYLDLGRAYEKNEENDKAIEMYREATVRNSQYAMAYLRIAILYGRKDTVSAFSSFDKSEALYRAQGNFEGVTEVLYQRGSLFDKLDKIDNARSQLSLALDSARTTSNLYQQIRVLLQLSSVDTTAGDRAHAKQLATEAITLARSNRMENLTAQALNEMGNAFYAGGEVVEAESYFKQALEEAQRYQGPRNEARARLSLGSLYTYQRKADQALPFIEQALQFFQGKGYRRETVRALTLLGYTKLLKGDYDGALNAFKQQLEVAQQTGEQTDIALAHDGSGNVLATVEQYPLALDHYRESYAIYNSQGNKSSAAFNLKNQAELLWRLGRFQDARTALKKIFAESGSSKDSNKQLVAQIHLLNARISLSDKQFPEAKAEALKAMGDVPTNSTMVGIKLVLGVVSAYTGAKAEAKSLCENAIEIATKEGDPRLLTEALIALAEVQLQSGDAQAARTTALDVQKRAVAANQLETEWRASIIAGSASLRLNEGEFARVQFSRANNVLAQLKQRWGDDALTSYLARSDITFYRQQASESANAAK